MAVDYGIPLITDVKCAKLLVSALYALKNQAPEVQTSIDCISEGRLIRLPGLIDTHVHLRYTQVSPDNYLMPCPSMGQKLFWTVQIILVEYQLFWSGPIRFGQVQIILDRYRL